MDDETISCLFAEWLSAFESALVTSGNDAAVKADAKLMEIEARLAATPANGFHGLVVKLGLLCFLTDHADAANALAESVYRDLVRLSGHDPVAEMSSRFQTR